MVLSKAQAEQFMQEGFLVVRGVAEPWRCDAIREAAAVHLKYKIPPVESEEEYEKKGKKEREEVDGTVVAPHERVTIRRLRQVYDRDILFRKWMEEPAIRPALYTLLGETPVLTLAHHNSIMTKMPHKSTQTRWHQDIRYWHFRNDNLLSVWLALQEENADNGVLEFIPGSHRMRFSPEQFDEKEYFREDLEQNRALISKKVSFTLQKGDVVFFHSRLLHRANKNSTDTPKIALVYTVKGISNEAIEGTRSARFPEVVLPIKE
jgi:phytanoyl-CoA hydroxylase